MKTIRNFKQATTDKINIIQKLYNIKSFAETIEFLTDRFVEENKDDMKKEHDKQFKAFLKSR